MFEKMIEDLLGLIFSLESAAQAVPNLGVAAVLFMVLLAYLRAPGVLHFVVLAFYCLSLDLGVHFWVSFAIASAVLSVAILRRNILSRVLILLARALNLLPKISETEKIALTSGTVWVDGQIFSGDLDLKWVFAQKYPKLSPAERRFLSHEVQELCKMCQDYEVQTTKDLPPRVWRYLKEKKFFGMIVPKKYGGLGFSAYAHSCVVETLASRSVPLAITVMVPNSLGPAELLLHYGTKEQQKHYLPRLADGREIPCFALTETGAGSDATSISSNGVLFKDENGEIKIKLNWRKRYITLGAVATTIGVAFQLYDPDNLLFEDSEIGITCALVPSKTDGVIQGRRHDPLATPFINSPLDGRDVIVGLDAVIGGENGLGKGWKMLMESLAAGRGISLPSTSSGGAKLAARATSAYAAIRQQFSTPIAKFEGVQEVLTRIASNAYLTDALRKFTAGAVDAGAKPAVVSAIAKYHATEIFRKTINDAMDVMGGRAIIRGKRNLLANAYFSTPISITVEGANIMTRSLIQFGQGVIMCHPYAYQEVSALQNGDFKAFDRAFFGHVRHFFANFSRALIYRFTCGLVISTPTKHYKIAKYQRKLAVASTNFALLTDLALVKFGGNLKRKESLNGRFADILSNIYLAICVIKKFEEEGGQKDDLALVEFSLKNLLAEIQDSFAQIHQNMFSKVGQMLLFLLIKAPKLSKKPNDELGQEAVENFTKNSNFRNRLTKGVYLKNDSKDNLGRLENALKWHESSLLVVQKIKSAVKSGILPKKSILELIDEAKKQGVINQTEKNYLKTAQKSIQDAMEVDEYSLEDY